MDMIQPLISQLTDTRTALDTIGDMLRQTGLDHAAEVHSFKDGIQAIREAMGAPTADKLLHDLEAQLAARLIFLFWNGIQMNGACFRDPTKKDFLCRDYEQIHQEKLLRTLPTVPEGATDLLRQLPQELAEPIISYICYIETYGYKLAHYLGFRVGDDFLPWIVPGYTSDRALTLCYERALDQYLKTGNDPKQGRQTRFII